MLRLYCPCVLVSRPSLPTLSEESEPHNTWKKGVGACVRVCEGEISSITCVHTLKMEKKKKAFVFARDQSRVE